MAEPRLPNDEPTTVDLLDRGTLVADLLQRISWAEPPYVIGIHGDWGAGKTSLLHMLRDGCPTAPRTLVPIVHEAWRHQRAADPAVALLWSIQQGFSALAKAGDAMAAAVKTATAPLLAAMKLANLLATPTTAALGAVAGSLAAWEPPTGPLPGVALQAELDRAVAAVAGDHGKLVVLIDDLDRCTDAAVVGVLEAIKLHLCTPRVVFVLAMDARAVEAAVQRQLFPAKDADLDSLPRKRQAQEYMEKLFQAVVHVPVPTDLGGLVRHNWRGPPAEADALLRLQADAPFLPGNPRKVKRFLTELQHSLDRAAGVDGVRPQLATAAALQAVASWSPEVYRLVAADPRIWRQVRDRALLGDTARGLHPELARLRVPGLLDGPDGPRVALTFHDPGDGTVLRGAALLRRPETARLADVYRLVGRTPPVASVASLPWAPVAGERPDPATFPPLTDEPGLYGAWRVLSDRTRALDPVAFPAAHGDAPLRLDATFQPLALRAWLPGPDGAVAPAAVDDLGRLVGSVRRVLLLGGAGAGKTTLARQLVRRLADRSGVDAPDGLAQHWPVCLPLAAVDLDRGQTGFEFLLQLAARQGPWAPWLEGHLIELAGRGQLLIVLDGWDEVADPGERQALAEVLADFMVRFPKVAWLVTGGAPALSRLPLDPPASGPPDRVPGALGLVRCEILALDAPRRDGLVRRRRSAHGTEGEPDPAVHDPGGLSTLPLFAGLLADLPGAGLPAASGTTAAADCEADLLTALVDAWLVRSHGAPVGTLRTWLRALATRLGQRRLWSREPRHGWVVPAGGLPEALDETTDPAGAAGVLDTLASQGGLLTRTEGGGVRFAHSLVQDHLFAEQLVEELQHSTGKARLTLLRRLARQATRASGADSLGLAMQLLAGQPDLLSRLHGALFACRPHGIAGHRNLRALWEQSGRPAVGAWLGSVPRAPLPHVALFADAGAELDGSPVLAGADEVHVQFCEDLDSLHLPPSDRLQILELRSCPELCQLVGLAELPGLRLLYIVDCDQLDDLAFLAESPAVAFERFVFADGEDVAVPDDCGWTVVTPRG
ncbi:MAG: NACHT domain-containing protein [Alphaproteobacteria bacterium]|nr:NACHT domain-containing protein [Alphaproteobacteria bacterium]